MKGTRCDRELQPQCLDGNASNIQHGRRAFMPYAWQLHSLATSFRLELYMPWKIKFNQKLFIRFFVALKANLAILLQSSCFCVLLTQLFYSLGLRISQGSFSWKEPSNFFCFDQWWIYEFAASLQFNFISPLTILTSEMVKNNQNNAIKKNIPKYRKNREQWQKLTETGK